MMAITTSNSIKVKARISPTRDRELNRKVNGFEHPGAPAPVKAGIHSNNALRWRTFRDSGFGFMAGRSYYFGEANQPGLRLKRFLG